ncbi:MAG: hypothetical protein AAGD05_10365, partial [Bacteroidota bacterium]
STHLHYNPQQVAVQELALKTAFTDLRSSRTAIRMPTMEDSISAAFSLNIQSDLFAQSTNLNDIRYFYPGIDSLAFLNNTPLTNWTLQASVEGDVNHLAVKQLEFSGFESQLLGNGTLKNWDRAERLSFDFDLQTLQTNGHRLGEMLTPKWLPIYVQLPKDIALRGTLKGNADELNANLNVSTNRSDTLRSQLVGTVDIQDWNNWDKAVLAIQLDTMRTNKADLLATLPPNALPEYVDLPDRFQLRGQLNGQLGDLYADLTLSTERAQMANEVSIVGSISELLSPEQTALDLSLNAAAFQPTDLQALLPDSLFPAYLRLPIIKELSGIIKGNLNDFNTQFQMESNTGFWTVEATSKEESYHLDLKLENSRPEEFFVDHYLDSLTGLSFSPWTLEAKLDGQGFDFSKSSFSDFSLQLKSAVDTLMSGWMIQGSLKDQLLSVEATASERSIEATSKIQVDYTNEWPISTFELDLQQLNLQPFLTDSIPFLINGYLSGHLVGATWENSAGKVAGSGIGLSYQTKTEVIDSIVLDFQLGGNEQFVDIASDLLEAHLEGVFILPSVVKSMQQQLQAFWESDIPNTLVGKTEDYFNFNFQLNRPELLTMGYLPQLKQLSPFQLSGQYDNRTASFELQTTLPFTQWGEYRLGNSSLKVGGKGQALQYDLHIESGNFNQGVVLQNTNLYGQIDQQVLNNTLILKDDQNDNRFEIRLALNWQEQDQMYWTFQPEQLLNYQAWQIRPENKIIWSNNKLRFNEWRLIKGAETVEVAGNSSETLNLSFTDFDLALISDLLQGNKSYLGGRLSGQLQLANLAVQPELATDLSIDSLLLLGSQLGNLTLVAKKQNKETVLASALLQGNGNDLRLKGAYHLDRQFAPFDFHLDLMKLNLPSIEPLF